MGYSQESNNQAVKEKLFTRDYILLIVTNGLLFFGFQFYPSGLPPFLKTLGADDIVLGFLTSLIAIPAILSRLIAGNLLDRYGRFKVLCLGLFSMTVLAYFLGVFQTVFMILLIRGLHGLAWGVSATGSATAVTDFIPRSRLGEGMGYFSLSCSLAMAIAPALALSLPFEWMFRLGTIFFAGAFILCLFVRYKKIEADRKEKRSLIEKRSLMPSFVVLCSNASYGAIVTFVALFGLERGISHVGMFFALYALALMVSRPYVGKLVDRIGCKAAIGPGIIALLLSLVLLSFVFNTFTFLACGVLYGLAQGAVMSGTQTLAILRAPKDRLGAANATYSSCFDLGLGVGALIFGFVAEYTGYGLMFLICGLTQVIPYVVLKLDKEPDAKDCTH